MKEDIENIYSRKDGRFEIRFHYGYRDDGTSNYKSVYENYKKIVQKMDSNMYVEPAFE